MWILIYLNLKSWDCMFFCSTWATNCMSYVLNTQGALSLLFQFPVTESYGHKVTIFISSFPLLCPVFLHPFQVLHHMHRFSLNSCSCLLSRSLSLLQAMLIFSFPSQSLTGTQPSFFVIWLLIFICRVSLAQLTDLILAYSLARGRSYWTVCEATKGDFIYTVKPT